MPVINKHVSPPKTMIAPVASVKEDKHAGCDHAEEGKIDDEDAEVMAAL